MITKIATAANMRYCCTGEINTSVNLRIYFKCFIYRNSFYMFTELQRGRAMLRQRMLRSDKTFPSCTLRHTHVIVFRIRPRISKIVNIRFGRWTYLLNR